MKDILYGGGHRVCDKCGETTFGSAIHYCRTKEDIKVKECGSIDDFMKEKKTMKDISSPELVKKADEFVEMIKNGTIKNRHTTLYDDLGKLLDEKLGDFGFKGNEFSSCLCPSCTDKECKEDDCFVSNTKEDIGDLMCRGEIKMDNNDFPGFGKVFAEVNKLWNKEDKSVNQQCSLTYKYFENWYYQQMKTKPQFTIEQFEEFIDTGMPSYIFNRFKTIRNDMIECASDNGYIIPVKSEEPLIVGNTMSYKGKNYLRQSIGNCTNCAFYQTECHTKTSAIEFGDKTDCAVTATIWKSFDDIIIDDSLACMRKDIGDIYIYNIEEDVVDKLIYVQEEIIHMEGWRAYKAIIRLATALEIQEYLKKENK